MDNVPFFYRFFYLEASLISLNFDEVPFKFRSLGYMRGKIFRHKPGTTQKRLISLIRSWCRKPFSTFFEWQKHMGSCVWKCSECSKGPLKKNKEIDQHISWHVTQRLKLSAIEAEVHSDPIE